MCLIRSIDSVQIPTLPFIRSVIWSQFLNPLTLSLLLCKMGVINLSNGDNWRIK